MRTWMFVALDIFEHICGIVYFFELKQLLCVYIWDVISEILVRNNATTLTEWNVFVGKPPTRPLGQRSDVGF